VIPMDRKRFEFKEVNMLFEEINEQLASHVNILLIGGGAMTLRNDKESTKDIDVVVSSDDYKILADALVKLGFEKAGALDPTYKQLDAAVFDDPRGFRLDIFVNRICKKFLVHDSLIERTETYIELDNLKVLMMSREDIFLSKSVTERDHDLDDMYILFTRGLNKQIIVDEASYQTEHSMFVWEGYLVLKISELEEKYDVTIDFKSELKKIAEQKM